MAIPELLHYRHFIPLFSRVAGPLYALTRKDVPFESSSACEDAFTQLKVLLTRAPILAFPNSFPEIFIWKLMLLGWDLVLF